MGPMIIHLDLVQIFGLLGGGWMDGWMNRWPLLLQNKDFIALEIHDTLVTPTQLCILPLLLKRNLYFFLHSSLPFPKDLNFVCLFV